MRSLLLFSALATALAGSDAAGFTREQVESGVFLALLNNREHLRADERVEVNAIDDGALLAVLLPVSHGGSGGRPVVVLCQRKDTQRYDVVMDTGAPVFVTHEEGRTQVFGYWHYSSREGKIDGLVFDPASSRARAGNLPVMISPDGGIGNLMLEDIRRRADLIIFERNSTP
jgi:hypothetical protein